MTHADHVQEYLDIASQDSAHSIKTRALFDGPLWSMSMPKPTSIMPTRPSVDEQAKRAYLAHKPKLTSAKFTQCKDRHGSALDDSHPWQCIMGHERSFSVETPHILTNQQWDWWNSFNQLNLGILPYSTKQMEWLGEARKNIRGVMTQAPKSHSVKFSTACHEHCLTEKTLFYTWETAKTKSAKSSWGNEIPPHSLQDVMSNFLNDQIPHSNLVDDCEGFDCSCKGNGDPMHDLENMLQENLQGTMDKLGPLKL